MTVADSETITMRGPRDEAERLYAALMSGDDDLHENNGRIVVCGKNKDGENIYLGDVSISAIYQNGVNAMGLIEKVRFGR